MVDDKFIAHLAQLNFVDDDDGDTNKGKEAPRPYKAYLNVGIGRLSTPALVDSGNVWRTAMSSNLMEKMGLTESDLRPIDVSRVGTAKAGQSLSILGELKKPIHVTLGKTLTRYKLRPVVVRDLSHDLNLSGPFLQRHGICQLPGEFILVNGQQIPLFTADGVAKLPKGEISISNLYVADKVTIPPMSRVDQIPLHVPEVKAGYMPEGDVLVSGSREFQTKTNLSPWLNVITTCEQSGRLLAGVINTTEEPVVIPAGVGYGTATLISWEGDKCQHKNRISMLGARCAEQAGPTAGTENWTTEQKAAWLKQELQLDKNPVLNTVERMGQALAVLVKNFDVFATDCMPGKTDLIEHSIPTGDIHPIKCKVRPLNPLLEEDLRKQLEKWLREGIVEPSTSPWSFGLVAARKKGNNKIRWCVDYRRLNSATEKDVYPLPSIDDNLSRLSESRLFSSIDCSGAFHVVPIVARDRKKTAFSTPWGLYQFVRMPFGLCNAPATYSRLVTLVLQGIPWEVCLPYLDDTLVHTATFSQHLRALDRVLAAHGKAGLRLQPSKCHLFQTECEYLGHLVTQNGVQPSPRHTKVIREWPLPQCRSDIRSFVGTCNYYRRFVRKFSAVAGPLTDLLQDDAKGDKATDPKERKSRQKKRDLEKITLSKEAIRAFNELKQRLVSSQVLAFPRFRAKEPFILDTDWSQDWRCVSGVVSQIQDGVERPIAFGSKKLNSAQANYSPYKGEMLAGVTFMQQWRYYLLPRPFRWRTDHQALRWAKTADLPDNMVSRWLDIVSQFNFEPEHRAGKDHGNADGLSRIRHGDPPDPEAETLGDSVMAIGTAMLQAIGACAIPLLRDVGQLREAQEQDEVLGQVRKWVREGKEPSRLERHQLTPAGRIYADLLSELRLNADGLLVRITDPNHRGVEVANRPCIPSELQRDLILEFHRAGGHMAAATTMQRLASKIFFPGMKSNVLEALSTCIPCQIKNKRVKDQRHTLVSVQSGFAFQKLSVDFVGPLPESANGNKFLLTVKCCFTRWVEAFPIKEATALNTVKALEREVFARYGIPEELHSDRGKQFRSNLYWFVAKEYGIEVTATPSYNPKSNPVERLHRDLGTMLRAVTYSTDQDWEECLPACLFALRTAVCRMTGFAPYRLLFGRDARMAIDIAFGKPPGVPAGGSMDYGEYVAKLRSRLDVAQAYARKHIAEQVRRQRKAYNSERRLFEVGCKVWLFSPPNNTKLGRFWSGPWIVTEKLSDVVVAIRAAPEMGATVPPQTVSIDRLKLYHTPPAPPGLLPPTEAAEGDPVMLDDEFAEVVDLPAADGNPPNWPPGHPPGGPGGHPPGGPGGQPPGPPPAGAPPPGGPGGPPPGGPGAPDQGGPHPQPENDGQQPQFDGPPLPMDDDQTWGDVDRPEEPRGRRRPKVDYKAMADYDSDDDMAADDDSDFDPRHSDLSSMASLVDGEHIPLPDSDSHQGGPSSPSDTEVPAQGKGGGPQAGAGSGKRMTAIEAIEADEPKGKAGGTKTEEDSDPGPTAPAPKKVQPSTEWLAGIQWQHNDTRGKRDRARSHSPPREAKRSKRSGSVPPSTKMSTTYEGDILPWQDIVRRTGTGSSRGMKRFVPQDDGPRKKAPQGSQPRRPGAVAGERTDGAGGVGAVIDRLIGDDARQRAQQASEGVRRLREKEDNK